MCYRRNQTHEHSHVNRIKDIEASILTHDQKIILRQSILSRTQADTRSLNWSRGVVPRFDVFDIIWPVFANDYVDLIIILSDQNPPIFQGQYKLQS